MSRRSSRTSGTTTDGSRRASTASSRSGKKHSSGSIGKPSVDRKFTLDYAAYRSGDVDPAEQVAYERMLEDFEKVGLRRQAERTLDRAVVSILLFSRGEPTVGCADDVLLSFCAQHKLTDPEFMSVLRDATLHLAKVRLAFWGIADPKKETYCPDCRQIIRLPRHTGHKPWCSTRTGRAHGRPLPK